MRLDVLFSAGFFALQSFLKGEGGMWEGAMGSRFRLNLQPFEVKASRESDMRFVRLDRLCDGDMKASTVGTNSLSSMKRRL